MPNWEGKEASKVHVQCMHSGGRLHVSNECPSHLIYRKPNDSPLPHPLHRRSVCVTGLRRWDAQRCLVSTRWRRVQRTAPRVLTSSGSSRYARLIM